MITSKKFLCLRTLTTAIIAVIAAAMLCSAAVTIKLADNQPLPSFEKNAVTYISLTKFCEAAGWVWSWDIYAQKLTCTWQQHKIVFTQDMSFYTVDETVMQLPVAPIRHFESLYLSAKLIPPIFNDFLKDPIEWLQNDKQFISSNMSAAVPSSVTLQAVAATQTPQSKPAPVDIVPAAPVAKTEPVKTIQPAPAPAAKTEPVTTTQAVPAPIDNAPVEPAPAAIKAPVQTPAIQPAPADSTPMEPSPATTESPSPITPKNSIPSINMPSNTTVDTTPSPYKKSEWEDLSAVHKNSDVPALQIIVIDPGHGGKDPGAIGANGTKEKDIVLAIGLKLSDKLKQYKGLSVYMTRSDDTFIPLVGRTRFANDKKADIFVSIHANSIRGTAKKKEEVKGYKIYFLSQAKNDEDKLAAMQENEVIRLEDHSQHNYDNLENILINMAGNEYLRESQDLSILVDQVFSQSLSTISKLHRGIGQANFWVLNGAYMPSILVETGFISNPDEELALQSESFQDDMANSLCQAILQFKQKIEGGH